MAWCLSISEKRFNELYPEMFEYRHIFRNEWKDDKDFVENYLSSKLWRMNNLYTILDKDGDKVPFVMNASQHKVYAASLIHPRLIILKSRQQGISTFWLIYFFDSAVTTGDLNLGLMAQGLDEAETLLRRVKFAWLELNDDIKAFFGITKTKENSKEFSFSNNSTLFIRTSFRSTTLQGLHISELGKIANKTPERAKETNTGTLQAIAAGNPVAIESTAEGDNMFKEKWDSAVGHRGPRAPKDLMPVFLSWLEDPDCKLDTLQSMNDDQIEYFERLELELGYRIPQNRKNFWVMQYRELGDDIYQEYPSTPEEAFAATRNGTYYAKTYREEVLNNGRRIANLYDPAIGVDVVMDLGMNDDFVLGYWQDYSGQDRLIGEYKNSGEGLEHYVNHINDTGYAINNVYVPHDIRVKELGTGRSRLHRLRELGVRRITVLPRISIIDGIEAVRRMMPHLWMDEGCIYTHTCFLNYTKEWDDKLQVWKDKPVHNDYSHGADMVRYRAMSKKEYYKAGQGKRRERSAKKKRTKGACLD
jgi:hypothetical protein